MSNNGTSNPGIPRVAIADGAITPKKLHDVLRSGRYFYANGNELGGPLTQRGEAVTLFDSATMTLGTLRMAMGPITFRLRIAGIVGANGPSKDAVGESVDWFNSTNTGDFFEYNFCSFPEVASGHDASEPFVYTVGSSDPLMIRVKGTAPVVASLQDFCVGFRKGEAETTKYAEDIDDVAYLAADLGDIEVKTNLNAGGVSAVDTGLNWANTEEHEFKVTLGVAQGGGGNNPAGVARFFVDGVEVGAPFTFDTGDEIFPFIQICNNRTGGAAGGLLLSELEVAYLKDIDDFRVK